MAHDSDSDDLMDALMAQFKTRRYERGFNEENWEEVTANCVNIRQLRDISIQRPKEWPKPVFTRIYI